MIALNLGFADRAARQESLWQALAIGAALGFGAWMVLVFAQWSARSPGFTAGEPAGTEVPISASTSTSTGPGFGEASDQPDNQANIRAPVAVDGVTSNASADSAFTPVGGWPDAVQAAALFDSQATDPLWSEPTERELLGVLAQFSGFAAHSVEADCRQSLCRLELIYPPGNTALYSIRQLYARIGELGLGPVLAEPMPEAGGVQTWRIYLRRRGEREI